MNNDGLSSQAIIKQLFEKLNQSETLEQKIVDQVGKRIGSSTVDPLLRKVIFNKKTAELLIEKNRVLFNEILEELKNLKLDFGFVVTNFFGQEVFNADVLRIFKERGVIPANALDLNFFQIRYPSFNDYPLIGLGDIKNETRTIRVKTSTGRIDKEVEISKVYSLSSSFFGGTGVFLSRCPEDDYVYYGGSVSRGWYFESQRALFLGLVPKVETIPSSTFRPAGNTTAPKINKFVANKHCTKRLPEHNVFNKLLKIYERSSLFKKFYLGVTEESIDSNAIYYDDIMMAVNNDSIIQHFGGTEKMVIPLAHVFNLMRRQPNCGRDGEAPGILLTNKKNNVFYVYDINGDLRVLTLSACSLGWCLSADQDPVSVSNLAHFDGRIFHR